MPFSYFVMHISFSILFYLLGICGYTDRSFNINRKQHAEEYGAPVVATYALRYTHTVHTTVLRLFGFCLGILLLLFIIAVMILALRIENCVVT